MKVFLIIIAVIIILIAIALTLKIKARLSMSCSKTQKFRAEAKINILGKKINIPIVGDGEDEVKDQDEPEETEDKKDDRSILEKIDDVCKIIEKSRITYALSRRSVKKRIVFENIRFKLTFGLDDAAKTGIATGFAWTAVYNLFAVVCRISSVKKHEFNILPDFENETYDLDFEGILKVSLVNIICICAVIYRSYKKACKLTDK